MSIMNLQPGAMVQAIKNIDPQGANVLAGDFGVVFKSQVHPLDSGIGQSFTVEGPLVRWIRQKECRCCNEIGGVCNVYDGDVVEVKSE